MDYANSLFVPSSLLIYEALLSRKEVSPQEKHYYNRLRKGVLGEKRLVEFLSTGNFENLVPLYGSLFEVDGAEFQIDCLLFTRETIFLLEVKNYVGDYFIENGRLFHFETKREIYNPVTQLERSEYLFKKMLAELRINIEVRPYVVFINPEFMIYEATPRLPMIFPAQVRRFLQKINANVPVPTENTMSLLQRLGGKRKERSSFERLPEYDLSQLRRGVFCEYCFAELLRLGRQRFVCSQCSKDFHIDDLVLFAIAQFHLLFPQDRITTKRIVDWCGGVFSKNGIRRILSNHLNVVVKGRHTHYKFKDGKSHLQLLSKKYLS